MANSITLKPTHRGLARKHLRNIFWAAVVIIAILLVVKLGVYGLMAKYDTTNLGAFFKKASGGYDCDELWMGLILALIASLAAAVIGNLYGLIDNFYRVKRIDVVDKSTGTITRTRYWPPASRSEEKIKFTRVIKAEVEQTTIDRILRTGTLSIKFIVYKNADSEGAWHTIPYLEDPYKAKKDVLKGLPRYTGLEVTTK